VICPAGKRGKEVNARLHGSKQSGAFTSGPCHSFVPVTSGSCHFWTLPLMEYCSTITCHSCTLLHLNLPLLDLITIEAAPLGRCYTMPILDPVTPEPNTPEPCYTRLCHSWTQLHQNLTLLNPVILDSATPGPCYTRTLHS
jgi:hypothetical protein